ncbi:hypothetical protein JF550_13935 [Microbacterium esteraromaticum]|uniref:DUF6079 family protein n=1 Tax=Microbacterium esteraromaticum TaxID=57043 RepID=UPI001A8E1C27|nr:DUF6079 family protein [Microbacterium esteraromaticum]MBN8417202.1 hypothetical protein [Microbacterium esteraromaticum]
MTYTLESPLRDLIDLPRRVEAADFVIKLDEGVARHEQTVRDYVVTDAIAEALGEGLDLVAGSLNRQSSRGAFLDGSFGSGKSHYMAVLHLLLSGDLNVRQIPGLEAVVADRQDLLERKLLVLDYNLLGAKSFEDALFGGYLSTVAARHPDAAPPVLHVSDGLLADASALRDRMGDEAFFDGLGGGDSAWGDLGSAWDAQSFEAAASAGPADADRVRLIGDLVNAYFSASVRSGEWLPMADGLRAITAHAKSLGYQGLVFLIDEIVLWLGQHLADQAWVQNEIEKVVQLAENAAANLPIPITSFLARQRDLRDFLGSHVAGAERTAQGQLFAYWEDRFDKIRLQAADLPKIVKQRLLQPVDSAAAYTLSTAVTEVKQDHAAWGYLLSDDANSDEKAFADVYPFSPALVDTMVALSSLMQRERTALKLMAELLSDGRDTLRVRDVIPVGDLYAPIVLGGSQPLTEEMKKHFAISAQFYRNKMRPYLLRKHGVTDSQAEGLERSHPFVTEDRLAKTVLIAALAPEARSLSNLTAAKLAALNWGTISAFIAGNEAVQVLGIVREWASEFGEISIGDGHDPIVTATLSGVDYDSILERISTEDNAQTRRELVRRLIAEELGLAAASVSLIGLPLTHVWRGNKRTVTVKFGNVRDDSEVLDSDLFHSDDQWRVIIDFPYDSASFSPADDTVRMQKLRDQGRSANTIAWIPNFLSDARQEDLGKLVLLEYLLTGSRFDANADHLPVADRGPAKQTLESRRRTLREVTTSALRQAYGVNAPDDSNVGTDLDGNQIFAPLTDGLTIAPPPTGTLRTGLFHALDAAWAHEFPNHPDLGAEEVTARRLGEALDLVTGVIEAGGRRQGLSRVEQRLAHDVVMPLRLGVLNENVLVVDAAHFGWNSEFARWTGELAGDLTVGALRTKLRGWGMTAAMENTVLLTWAALGNWEFIGIDNPSAQTLPDGAAVRRANLPDDADFTLAQVRAAGIFGVQGESHLTPRAVARFATATREAVRISAIADLVQQLEKHATVLGLEDDAVGRLATARRVNDLVAKTGSARTEKDLVEVLATFDLPDELTALGRTFATAERLAGELQGLDWGIITAAQARRDASFESSLAELRTTAALNESVAPLEPRLKDLAARARALIVGSSQSKPAVTHEPHPGSAPVEEPLPGHEGRVSGTLSVPLTDLDEVLAKLKSDISATHASTGTVTITWQVD